MLRRSVLLPSEEREGHVRVGMTGQAAGLMSGVSRAHS